MISSKYRTKLFKKVNSGEAESYADAAEQDKRAEYAEAHQEDFEDE